MVTNWVDTGCFASMAACAAIPFRNGDGWRVKRADATTFFN